MNTPNPLVPQGTFADKGKARIRNTVFVIIASHCVLFVGLLFAGCNKKDGDVASNDPGLPQTPPVTGDPNPTWPTPPPPATQNLPVASPLPTANLTPTQPPQNTTVAPPVPEAPTSGFTEHTILKGDTFSSLGLKYKVGYKAIADANSGVDPGKLKIGQKVRIPPPRAIVANAQTGPGLASGTTDATGEKLHTVKSGDNLYTLARNYGVTAKEIQVANKLRTTQIFVGQKLKIPSKAPPPVEATTAPPAAVPSTPAFPPDGTAPLPGTAPR
jgi:LysM repeat protein